MRRVVLLAAALLAAGGCGEDAGVPAAARGDAERETLTAAERAVATAQSPATGFSSPTTAVKPPSRPKRLGIIPCGPFSGCLLNAKGAAAAARALGWSSTTVTPVSADPQEVNGIFRRLIDSGVDAIVWVGFPRTILGPSLAAAKAKGVMLVSLQTADGDPLDISYGDPGAPMQALGEQIGWWMIADSGGAAQVIVLSDDEFVTGKAIDAGLARVLGRCGGCRIVATKDITVADQATAAARETTNLLKRHPDADYVFAPFVSRVPFMVQGARDAQRRDVKLATTKVDTADIDAMRPDVAPKLNAGVSVPEMWAGWAAVDRLLRLMAGQAPEPYALPLLLRTEDSLGAPFFKPQSSTDAVDFAGAFKRLWGVS